MCHHYSDHENSNHLLIVLFKITVVAIVSLSGARMHGV